MNWATSAGCWSRTSETKYSAIACAADLERPLQPRRIRGSAQGQRRHLQHRRPPLAALMEQGQVGSGELDTEVRQQVTALGEGEIQVTIANLAQLTRHPEPVLP